VLNIVEEESKLFITKQRAPFMICVEIYRPEEILVTTLYQSKSNLEKQVKKLEKSSDK
jgi:hypothetical protein